MRPSISIDLSRLRVNGFLLILARGDRMIRGFRAQAIGVDYVRGSRFGMLRLGGAVSSALMMSVLPSHFLAHDAAQLITGETLYVDGGYHIID